MTLWAGRLSGQTDTLMQELNSSIRFDSRMAEQDIRGSIAHAAMLGKQGIIDPGEAAALQDGLRAIWEDVKSGKLPIDMECEDIHTFVEQELTKRLGQTGKRLHTARSRNDQVALDIRLYLADQNLLLQDELKTLIETVCRQAEKHLHTVMPGYTHLQRAQPVTLAHHLMAYAQMLRRDIDRLRDCRRRTCVSPLGSGALAGTTYPLDRAFVAEQLGFSGVTANSMDGVADRDFCVELCACLSLLMVHLSRFSEEMILWCSWEYRFATLDDRFSTGSSIMPQKKNPDLAELTRGKSARVIGDLNTLLTMLKGLPMAYNKDMQEDKEAVFDACDTALLCLKVFQPMLETCVFHPAIMKAAAAQGFINATDAADYLVRKGVPFRDAYKTVGRLVNVCTEQGKTLETLPLAEYQRLDPNFKEDVYEAVDLLRCVSLRKVEGGPAPEMVKKQIDDMRNSLEEVPCIAHS